MANKDETKNKDAQSTEKKKRSPVVLIVVVVLILALLGGGGFVAWKTMIASPQKGAGNGQENAKFDEAKIIPLDTFIVNLADTDIQRYLKVVIKLETLDPGVNEEIQKRMAQLRDAIITLLTTQTFEEASTFKGKTFLRTEIMNRLNSYLRTGTIRKVYFTDFVIQ